MSYIKLELLQPVASELVNSVLAYPIFAHTHTLLVAQLFKP